VSRGQPGQGKELQGQRHHMRRPGKRSH
jgi:hypothetical protein